MIDADLYYFVHVEEVEEPAGVVVADYNTYRALEEEEEWKRIQAEEKRIKAIDCRYGSPHIIALAEKRSLRGELGYEWVWRIPEEKRKIWTKLASWQRVELLEAAAGKQLDV